VCRQHIVERVAMPTSALQKPKIGRDRVIAELAELAIVNERLGKRDL